MVVVRPVPERPVTKILYPTLLTFNPVQTAWIEEQVNQCGYCISGWVLSAAELLKEKPKPDDDDIRMAFAALICRCGTHNAAVRAVKRASGQL